MKELLMKIHNLFMITILGWVLLFSASSDCFGGTDKLPGEYRTIDEPSIHEPGKVILLEFADFYCPHCHMFEQTVVSKLKKEFGNHLKVRFVGFPVIRGKLPTAFEMYEQARKMGKGQEMKRVLFRTIHHEKIQILDKRLRVFLIREVGLDVEKFEKGLASGQPYKALEEGKAWGERIGVTHTPTVVLNGNIRVDNLDVENLRTLIRGILKKEKAG